MIVALPPLALVTFFLVLAGAKHSIAYDFVNAFRPAGDDVLNGRSPFPPIARPALQGGTAFVYPVPAAFLAAPFALLPSSVAAGLFTLLLVSCAIAALWLAGLRDWRCYLMIGLWWPVLSAIQSANLTLLLALGAAIVWRYRDRPIASGLAAAVLVSLKLFLWPVLLWLVASRRYMAAVWGLAGAVVITLGTWAVIGFRGLADYLPLVHLLARMEERDGYTLLAVGLKLGLGFEGARVLWLAVGVATLAGTVLIGRRGDEKRAFALALVASLLCSPIVWLHYFAILIVAFAVLGAPYAVWALPFLALGPARPLSPSWWAISVLFIFALALGLSMVRDWSRPVAWLRQRLGMRAPAGSRHSPSVKV